MEVCQVNWNKLKGGIGPKRSQLLGVAAEAYFADELVHGQLAEVRGVEEHSEGWARVAKPDRCRIHLEERNKCGDVECHANHRQERQREPVPGSADPAEEELQAAAGVAPLQQGEALGLVAEPGGFQPAPSRAVDCCCGGR